MKRSSALFNEKWIFFSVLLINILLISSQKFIPSMDGPAHLYNSNILLNLLKGDSSYLNEFYSINSLWIPNWISHFLLASLKIFFPGWLAEKLLMILYISGLAFSFRSLLKILNPENVAYSIMIFPFIYSFLFHLGFYNYCISFIFFFFSIYYWIKFRKNISLRHTFILLLLFTLTYYSSLLTFLFLGLCIGILILAESLLNFLYSKKTEPLTGIRFRPLFQLFMAALPALILLIIFYTRTEFHSTNQYTDARELIKWLNDVRPLIVYNYINEEIFTGQILHILIALLAISLYVRFSANRFKILRLNDFFIIPLLTAFVLLLIIPSGGYAGMMSDRLALMFYMIIIVLFLSQELPGKIKYIFIPLILIIHFTLLVYHYDIALRQLNRNAVMIHETSGKITTGSIILPVDMTENWLEIHFSNYLGTDKELIILENYEASVGWFPVRWNTEKIPNILLGNQSSVNGISWQTNTKATVSRQIDYIFLYGQTKSLEKTEWQELSRILNDEYTPYYSSDNEYIRLYRRN